MKRKNLLKLVGALVLAAVITIAFLPGCAAEAPTPAPAPAPAPAEVIHWRWQHLHGPATAHYQNSTPDFCNQVREMSGGRLDITVYTAGELVASVDVCDAVSTGVVEMSHTYAPYFFGAHPSLMVSPGAFPPGLWQTFQDVLYIYNEMGVGDLAREVWAEQNIHFLTLVSGGHVSWWSKEPIYDVEDLQGVKLRYSGNFAKTAELLGASPVFMPSEEMYTALATGVLDAGGTSVSYYRTSKFYEVAPYLYAPNWKGDEPGELIVNMDAWNALTDDLKEIVAVAAERYAHDLALHYLWELDEIYASLDEWGCTLITWSDEEFEKVTEAGMKLLPEVRAADPRAAEACRIVEDFAKMRGYM